MELMQYEELKKLLLDCEVEQKIGFTDSDVKLVALW